LLLGSGGLSTRILGTAQTVRYAFALECVQQFGPIYDHVPTAADRQFLNQPAA
jgi:hypothetical protein